MNDAQGAPYAEEIVALYCGELYGQLLFEALAARTGEPADAALWRVLADVERLTGKRLEARALALGATHDVQAELAQARLHTQMALLAGKSTREICEYYQPRVPKNLARLRALRARAPEQDHTLLTQVIAHSAVFGTCLSHWLDGDLRAAADALRGYLDA